MPEDLLELLQLWIQRAPLIDMFASLPFVRKSKKPSFDGWRYGVQGSDAWAADFDTSCEFVGGAFIDYLPRLLRARARFAPLVEPPVVFDWHGAARLIEARQDQFATVGPT